MTSYVAIVCALYLAAVIGDYLTTARHVRAGGEEINPVFRGKPPGRLLYPFLGALPPVALGAAREYHHLTAGAYERAGWFLYRTDEIGAQIASLTVLAALAVSAHKTVASLSNLATVRGGVGLPDLVIRILPRDASYRTVHLVLVPITSVVVLPLIALLRWIIRTVT